MELPAPDTLWETEASEIDTESGVDSYQEYRQASIFPPPPPMQREAGEGVTRTMTQTQGADVEQVINTTAIAERSREGRSPPGTIDMAEERNSPRDRDDSRRRIQPDEQTMNQLLNFKDEVEEEEMGESKPGDQDQEGAFELVDEFIDDEMENATLGQEMAEEQIKEPEGNTSTSSSQRTTSEEEPATGTGQASQSSNESLRREREKHSHWQQETGHERVYWRDYHQKRIEKQSRLKRRPTNIVEGAEHQTRLYRPGHLRSPQTFEEILNAESGPLAAVVAEPPEPTPSTSAEQ